MSPAGSSYQYRTHESRLRLVQGAAISLGSAVYTYTHSTHTGKHHPLGLLIVQWRRLRVHARRRRARRRVHEPPQPHSQQPRQQQPGYIAYRGKREPPEKVRWPLLPAVTLFSSAPRYRSSSSSARARVLCIINTEKKSCRSHCCAPPVENIHRGNNVVVVLVEDSARHTRSRADETEKVYTYAPAKKACLRPRVAEEKEWESARVSS